MRRYLQDVLAKLHTGAHTVRKDKTTNEFLLGALWQQLEMERKNLHSLNPWLAGKHICTDSMKARHQSVFSHEKKKRHKRCICGLVPLSFKCGMGLINLECFES